MALPQATPTPIYDADNVGLCFMNNLAHAHRMIPIFEYGFRVGTIGPYSVQAIRKQMRADTGQ